MQWIGEISWGFIAEYYIIYPESFGLIKICENSQTVEANYWLEANVLNKIESRIDVKDKWSVTLEV